MVGWLESDKDPSNEETVYSIDWAKAKYEVRELIPDSAWLVLNKTIEHWMKFAVLQFCFSDDRGVRAKCVFHGEGPSNVLRECRHTHWGDEGYIFYPNGKVIIAAFHALSEFYDDMSPPETP